jgi:geranylgeranyl diphosphate synthase, type II
VSSGLQQHKRAGYALPDTTLVMAIALIFGILPNCIGFILNSFFSKKKLNFDSINNHISKPDLPESPASLYDPIRYIMQIGGKRLRPRLVIAGCGICGGDVNEAYHAAAAVESLHNFTLIHDDIMDNADTRRGMETVHRKWNMSTAILSGDALFAYSFGLLSYYGLQSRYTKDQYLKLNQIFLDATRTVCEGQALDMDFESRKDVHLNEYLAMIGQKTAALLKASLQMGAVVAGASEEQIQNLGDIGYNAGVAFQIQDDLLDATGNPEKFGKKTGGDIAAGKKTFLTILSTERASSEQNDMLQSVLASRATYDIDIKRVIDLYDRLGVIATAKAEIQKLYSKASASLKSFPQSDYRDEINSLLNELMSRQT